MKDQMLQMFLIQKNRMHKWYHKLFKRLLNASVMGALKVYRKNCDKHVEHLSFRALLVEGLFPEYGATGERKIGQPERHASDMIPRLKECFPQKITTNGEKNQDRKEDVMCAQRMVERRRMCNAAGSV